MRITRDVTLVVSHVICMSRPRCTTSTQPLYYYNSAHIYDENSSYMRRIAGVSHHIYMHLLRVSAPFCAHFRYSSRV